MSELSSSSYPVLPLRDIVVFPHMIVPLFVGREKSVRALEAVMKDDKQILLASQKDASEDEPKPDSIYRVGVLANVLHVANVGFGGTRFPTPQDFAVTLDDDDAARAADDGDDDEEAEPGDCICTCCCGSGANRLTAFDREDDDEDDAEEVPTDTDSGERPVGRRLAVCIGIDTYPTMPLSGCVNDSRAWQARLEKAGFEITALLGDYRGGAWDPRAEVWMILAART